MDILRLPFNQHLGLEMTWHLGVEVVSLTPRPHHMNHVGTVHAGALYSLAEAASGHALLEHIPLPLEEAAAVVRSAEVKYRRPASGRLVAVADVDDESSSQFRTRLEAKGRATLSVTTCILCGEDDQEVFRGEFVWFVSRNT